MSVNMKDSFDDEKTYAAEHHEAIEGEVAAILSGFEGSEITPAESSAIVRRIDWYILPLMYFVFALQFLDKLAYSLSSQFGSLVDLQLTESINGVTSLARYSNGSMIFWCGFTAGIYPLTFIAQRMPVSKACSSFVMLWGGIFLCAPLCRSYNGILAQRFCLGFMESGVTPAFMFITAAFYSKGEQASRSAIWFSATGGAQVLGYPILYGLLGNDFAFPKWWAIYFLFGAMTIFSSVLFFFFVPDSPTTARFLSDRQKYVAVERLRSNQAPIEGKQWKGEQAIEALTDLRCLIMIPLAFLTVIPNATVSTFTPIVLRGLGYTPMKILLMTMPSGLISGVYVASTGLLQQRFRNMRAINYTASILMVIGASSMLWKLPTTSLDARYAAVLIFPVFTSAFVSLLSLTVSNVSGQTKRAVANAMFLMGYSVGQIAAPLTFNALESPAFPTGFKITLICLCLGLLFMYSYTFLCWRENRRRDGLGEAAKASHSFEDMTDKQNLAFRYEL